MAWRIRSAIGHRVLVPGFREHDAELLAAEPAGDVEGAELLLEDVGDAAQDRVTGEMAVRVVDVAEQVEVGEEDRQRTLETPRAFDLGVECRVKYRALKRSVFGIEPGGQLEPGSRRAR